MTEMQDWPALMSPAVAALYCDMSRSTLERKRKEKTFPPASYELGERQPRWKRADIDAWIKKLRVAS